MGMKKERKEVIALLDEALTIAHIMKERAWASSWSYRALKNSEKLIRQLEKAKNRAEAVPEKPDAT